MGSSGAEAGCLGGLGYRAVSDLELAIGVGDLSIQAIQSVLRWQKVGRGKRRASTDDSDGGWMPILRSKDRTDTAASGSFRRAQQCHTRSAHAAAPNCRPAEAESGLVSLTGQFNLTPTHAAHSPKPFFQDAPPSDLSHRRHWHREVPGSPPPPHARAHEPALTPCSSRSSSRSRWTARSSTPTPCSCTAACPSSPTRSRPPSAAACRTTCSACSTRATCGRSAASCARPNAR